MVHSITNYQAYQEIDPRKKTDTRNSPTKINCISTCQHQLLRKGKFEGCIYHSVEKTSNTESLSITV